MLSLRLQLQEHHVHHGVCDNFKNHSHTTTFHAAIIVIISRDGFPFTPFVVAPTNLHVSYFHIKMFGLFDIEWKKQTDMFFTHFRPFSV